MNKNEFLKGLESQDIIKLMEKDGVRELIFTEKNVGSTIETRHHHNKLTLNSLVDFRGLSHGKNILQIIYSFNENRIYCLEEVDMELQKKALKVVSFAPLSTEELCYWSKGGEKNIKKFLNKLSLVADKDTVKDIRLMFAEFEISEKVDAKNESLVVKVVKNTLKNLPEVLTIRFNPYMFVDDFKIEMDIYLDWSFDHKGFESVKWDFESSLIKNLFYEHLKSETDLQFIIGDFTPVTENYLHTYTKQECKGEEGVPY